MPLQLVEGPVGDEGPGEARRRRLVPGGSQDVTSTSNLLVRFVLTAAALAYVLVVVELGWNLAPEHEVAAAEAPVQSTPETSPPNALRMGPVSTGVLAVDGAVNGFLRGDVDEASSALVVQQVRCGTLPWQGTPALKCLATEAPGTAHDLFLASCEAKWVSGEAARAELTTLLAETPGLYAVSAVAGGYSAVLAWPGSPDRSLVLTISSAGVTSFGAGCGIPLAPGDGRELALVKVPAR